MPTHCHKNTGGWFNWFKTHDLGIAGFIVIDKTKSCTISVIMFISLFHR